MAERGIVNSRFGSRNPLGGKVNRTVNTVAALFAGAAILFAGSALGQAFPKLV